MRFNDCLHDIRYFKRVVKNDPKGKALVDKCETWMKHAKKHLLDEDKKAHGRVGGAPIVLPPFVDAGIGDHASVAVTAASPSASIGSMSILGNGGNVNIVNGPVFVNSHAS